MGNNKIKELAKKAGGVGRYFGLEAKDGTAFYTPEILESFYALAFQAGAEAMRDRCLYEFDEWMTQGDIKKAICDIKVEGLK